MTCSDFELKKRIKVKFHGDARIVNHLAQSVKPLRILASMRQHYQRENVYFQSTFAVTEGTHTYMCVYIYV